MIRLFTWTGCTNGFMRLAMNVHDDESLDRSKAGIISLCSADVFIEMADEWFPGCTN